MFTFSVQNFMFCVPITDTHKNYCSIHRTALKEVRETKCKSQENQVDTQFFLLECEEDNYLF